jgi:N-sulfoglucosamine sulfohydrolase
VGRLKGTASARPEAVFASHVFHEITMYYPMRAVRTERWKLIWNLAHQLEFPLASDLWESPSWQAIRERKGGRMGARSTRDYLKRPEYELYDLEADPDETRNLARSPAHSGTLANLKARILEMMKATGDPWSIRLREERKPRGDSG